MTTQNALTDYLERVAHQHPADSDLLSSIAPRHFGTTDPLSPIYVRKTLIAAVARAMTPGCRVDSVLVLQGPQGTGKTAWFRRLMPNPAWFDDELSTRLDVKDQIRLGQAWFAGWAEFYNLIMVADEAQLKYWCSITVDRFRFPYQVSIAEAPRRCVLVGTTNVQKLLLTPEESRRFWVVPVARPILLEIAEAERDRIWAAAYHAYQAGESWHINAADYPVMMASMGMPLEGGPQP